MCLFDKCTGINYCFSLDYTSLRWNYYFFQNALNVTKSKTILLYFFLEKVIKVMKTSLLNYSTQVGFGVLPIGTNFTYILYKHPLLFAPINITSFFYTITKVLKLCKHYNSHRTPTNPSLCKSLAGLFSQPIVFLPARDDKNHFRPRASHFASSDICTGD